MADEPADVPTIPIAKCVLGLSDATWDFAVRHADAIDEHWARARAERPKLFNGVVYLLNSWELNEGTLSGTLFRTNFKSFLYWRETGCDDAGVRDAFGASLICSADGAVLLGRQTEGYMNSGLTYPPSGVIDADDVGPDGVDIDANIVRELEEESGLRPADLDRVPGYLVAFDGTRIAIGLEWRSPLEADALRAQVLEHIGRQTSPELADIVIVRRRQEMDRIAMPPFARALLSRILRA